MGLFRKYKISQRPDALIMSEAEARCAMNEAKVDRHDILDFLNGENVLLIERESEELEVCDYSEILAGLELYQQQVKEQGGIDEYIKLLQREGRFDAFENAASRLVAGFDVNISEVKRMPEETLRQWLIDYIHCLAEGKWKAERKVTSHFHGEIGWGQGM